MEFVGITVLFFDEKMWLGKSVLSRALVRPRPGCLSRGRYLTSLGPYPDRTSQNFALYYNVAHKARLT
uniref:Uncharacterized protein n=1 Tax=Brassica oleracea var. oleracea TaxID=109376 RepID=A0A0D3DSX8_BRAOL